jgi:hypothetical protein
MTFGKMLLWGGVGYIGYKLLTKKAQTYAPGDATAVQLVEAAKKHLDPLTLWELNVGAGGAVSLQGKRGDQIIQAQTFPNAAAALAWITKFPPAAPGGPAQVTFSRS